MASRECQVIFLLLASLRSLLIYDSFLLECPLIPPETTDPASKCRSAVGSIRWTCGGRSLNRA